MSVVYISALIMFTCEIGQLYFSIYSKDYQNWSKQNAGLEYKIKQLIVLIPYTLIAISLLYNLARWFLIIQEKHHISGKFQKNIIIFTLILSLGSLIQEIILFIDKISFVEQTIIFYLPVLIILFTFLIAYSVVFHQMLLKFKLV